MHSFRFDHAGVDGVYANLPRTQFLGKYAGDGVDGSLSGGVPELFGGRAVLTPEPILMMVPPSGPMSFTASLVVSSRPSALRLKWLWKCSSVTESRGAN